MNKHINDLAVKAGAHVRNVCYGHGDYRIELQLSDESIEQFAKLLIQECIGIVNTWSDEEPCSEGYDIIPVNMIKERFGVE